MVCRERKIGAAGGKLKDVVVVIVGCAERSELSECVDAMAS
jgi:hypothetical protein